MTLRGAAPQRFSAKASTATASCASQNLAKEESLAVEIGARLMIRLKAMIRITELHLREATKRTEKTLKSRAVHV